MEKYRFDVRKTGIRTNKGDGEWIRRWNWKGEEGAEASSYDSGALSKLLNSLQENKNEIPSCTEEEFGFLSELLQSKELNALVNVHNKILNNVKDDKFFPVLSNAMDIDIEVLDLLSTKTHLSKECKELFHLLQKPHIQGLLCAHDAVAQKDYYPRLPEIPLEVDEDEETVKIVQLVKSNEPLVRQLGRTLVFNVFLECGAGVEPILGATMKTCEVTGKIVIARIMHGGAADRSGLIHVGDEIYEVNGISVEGKTPNCVLKIMQNSEGTITFKIVPADSKGEIRESKVRVRAHFSYKAAEDPYIPCIEAGLDFSKGDILHIVSQDDVYWWQARREGDRNMRAGLIPCRALQERRIILERQQKEKTDNDNIMPLPALCPRPSTSLHASPTKCNLQGVKTKKIMYDAAENDDFDREEIPTYEEVAKLYPRPGLYRPVVLIGPPGVGRNELKRRLMATDPDKYKTPVPYTSRPPRPGEVNGKEYHFVSREKMEEEIEAGKFIEYGEYKGNLYGTNSESVSSLINAGYVCLLNPHYQALKMLRTPQTKPYVIYIKPPRFEILKETRNDARARSTFDESNSRGFTDEEFHEILHSAARIEFLYSHLFDEVIVNADLPIAFTALGTRFVGSINYASTEDSWKDDGNLREYCKFDAARFFDTLRSADAFSQTSRAILFR
ncbi:MAGUK p55 subfamily member 7 [Eufriesea mexicana]|nr:MAGUK p55 subfamily member 7 [Eufriesea mexicana]